MRQALHTTAMHAPAPVAKFVMLRRALSADWADIRRAARVGTVRAAQAINRKQARQAGELRAALRWVLGELRTCVCVCACVLCVCVCAHARTHMRMHLGVASVYIRPRRAAAQPAACDVPPRSRDMWRRGALCKERCPSLNSLSARSRRACEWAAWCRWGRRHKLRLSGVCGIAGWWWGARAISTHCMQGTGRAGHEACARACPRTHLQDTMSTRMARRRRPTSDTQTCPADKTRSAADFRHSTRRCRTPRRHSSARTC